MVHIIKDPLLLSEKVALEGWQRVSFSYLSGSEPYVECQINVT